MRRMPSVRLTARCDLPAVVLPVRMRQAWPFLAALKPCCSGLNLGLTRLLAAREWA